MKKFLKNKSGQLSSATSIAVGLVTLVLVVAVGAIVLGDFQGTQTSGSYAYNISGDGLTSLDNMSSQIPTVGTIAIASILIALVVAGFVVARR